MFRDVSPIIKQRKWFCREYLQQTSGPRWKQLADLSEKKLLNAARWMSIERKSIWTVHVIKNATYIVGIIIASGINFYNFVLRLNELIT